eukprot:TRINITY_DN1221_c0_g1_i9.p1 TRINITY_DN1221_c0_g1~~TRINITY_DN1221_c0_g1_i9.p1  ORF type:complete len:370 (-),score=47.64 TRINITY_DN1221_c0_g1_i9:321-1430(-)
MQGAANASNQQQLRVCKILGLSLMSLERVENDSPSKKKLKKEALQNFTKGVTLDENDVVCQYHLALLLAEEREYESALAHVRKAMEVSQGKHVKSWGLLANILSAKKQLPQALKILNGQISQQGTKHGNDEILIIRLKARILSQSDRQREAIDLLESLTDDIQSEDCTCDLTSKLDVYEDLCNTYLLQDKIIDAEQQLEAIKKLCPNCSRFFKIEGTIFSSINQQEKAMAAWETATTLDPQDAEAVMKLGEAYQQIGGESCLAFACQMLQDAIRRRKDLQDAWYSLGLAQQQRGMGVKAEQSLRQAVLLGETAPVLSFALFPIEVGTQVEVFNNAFIQSFDLYQSPNSPNCHFSFQTQNFIYTSQKAPN